MKKVQPIHSNDIIDKNTDASHGIKWCCVLHCDQEGTYPAPKPRPRTNERYWFCLEHIRRYNSSWNYFSGMSDHEVESYQRSVISGHRPTWKMGVAPNQATAEKILDKIFTMFDIKEETSLTTPTIPANERHALATLDLSYPITLKEIKIRYKKLVKLYHPDINTNDKNAQDKFIAVNKAYNCLLESNYFLP